MDQLVNAVLLAERMHWTIDYVLSMDSDLYIEVREILKAYDMAASQNAAKWAK